MAIISGLIVGGATIGAAAINASSKKSGGSSTQDVNTGPWAPQAGYDKNGLMQAQNIYSQRIQAGPYTGEMVAPGNEAQGTAINQAAEYSGDLGQNLPRNDATTGSTMLAGAEPFTQNAEWTASHGIQGPNQGLYGTLQGYGTGANTIEGANAPLSSALNDSAVSGAKALGGFQNDLQSVATQGLSDPTQRISGDAQTYANSPQTQAALASTNAAINQTLNESTLPTLNQGEAAHGAVNSSRSGMAEGMAREGAGIAEGQADANIENNALNTGMSTATNLYDSGMQSATSAGMFGYNDVANNANTQSAQQIGLNENNAATRIGAANAGLGTNLNYELGNVNTSIASNNQLGEGARIGLAANAGSLAGATSNFNLGAAAGTLQQNMQQAKDTNAYDVWGNNNTYDQNVLGNYWGIVSTPLGTSGTSSSQVQAPFNPLGALAGAASLGYGIYKNSAASGNGTSPANAPVYSNQNNATYAAASYGTAPTGLSGYY